MMAHASPHQSLQEELNLITCMIDMMKQEQHFLVAADTEALGALTPLKLQLIDQMAHLAGKRHAALAADGFAATETGMEGWLVRMAHPGINSLWQQLLEKTREAKEINRLNGMLVNKQLSHTETLITAMRTPAGAADQPFYGPSGQSAPVTGKRRLVIG